MRYLLLLLALPLLLGASGGPQVLDDLGQRRFAGGPWVSSYESDETDAWPAWDEQVLDPALVTDFSTAGWPREYGKICVTFTSGASGEYRSIIDGRQDGDDPRPYLSVVNDGRIRFGIQTVGSIAGGEIIPFHTHTACVDRSYGPTTSLYLDGLLIGTSTSLPAWDWHPTARLGSRYGGADPLGGTIASIQWRGFRMACDMRSDTCSDGRQIATTRPTPVPCEVSPGVWEMVPEDEGCYSVRGLESWAANTSYLSWGAELDRSPWGIQGDAEIMQIADGFRVCHTTSSVNSGIRQSHTIGLDETATLSVIARRNTASGLFLSPFSNGGGTITMSPAGWGTYSRTETRTIAATAFIYPRPGGVAQCVDLLAAWLTKSNTPGRACWGGEAPVTCAADRHTIGTEGWPTEAGEISVTYTPQGVGIGTAMYLAATTAGGENQPSGFYLYRISTSGALVFGLRRGDTVSGQATQDLAWENGRSYHVRVRWSPERAEIWRDGVLLRSWVPATVPDSHPDVVHIGTNTVGTSPAQGAIRSLTVRSYEEVSP